MSAEHDPLKKVLTPGTPVFPEVDMEVSIMAAVRIASAAQQKARRLRRLGLLFLTIFLSLLGLALWFTKYGYTHPAYQEQVVNYGFAILFILVLFAQLEAWWHKSLLG